MLSFVNQNFDPYSKMRGNKEWAIKKWKQKKAKLLIVWKGLFPLNKKDELIFLKYESVDFLWEMILLGVDFEETAIFYSNLSNLTPHALLSLLGEHNLRDIRSLAKLAPPEQATLASKAFSLQHWRSLNRFCGVCGEVTDSHTGGYELTCSSGTCKTFFYPRIDPVVIVLVEKYDLKTKSYKCLLVLDKKSTTNDFSLIGGFAEPGETMINAAIRETKEETGVEIGNVEQVSCQPWPFPHSIAFGHFAYFNGGKIAVDGKEIVDARWFSLLEVKALMEESWNKTQGKMLSMDRYLLQRWLIKRQ